MAPNFTFNNGGGDDDDDFQEPSTHSRSTTTCLKPISTNIIGGGSGGGGNTSLKNPKNPNPKTTTRPHKKLKHPGKENRISHSISSSFKPPLDDCYSLQSRHQIGSNNDNDNDNDNNNNSTESRLIMRRDNSGITSNGNNSIESRLIMRRDNNGNSSSDGDVGMKSIDLVEDEYELDLLLKLCGESNDVVNDPDDDNGGGGGDSSPICCPLCGIDISELSDEQRQLHTNQCLDQQEASPVRVSVPNKETAYHCPGQVLDGSPVLSPKKVVDVTPVLEWLRNLGLSKYEEVFVRDEIDWDTLQWLTEEDLYSIGITAFGPRKKIIHALSELRRNDNKAMEKQADAWTDVPEETGKQVITKLITDYFPGSVSARQRGCVTNKAENEVGSSSGPALKKNSNKNHAKSGKQRDIPMWCCIPGTSFRVENGKVSKNFRPNIGDRRDAFKYLRRDCSHWFLTHFHIDHYQGLTKSFSHGKVYCSSITAKLVNLKIGIPWERLEVLPLNQKINIEGISITCFDANHCPGSIIILFEPPNGKAVLHTGDFRFSEEMGKIFALLTSRVHTLILDTTYCDPQYDFPKQEAVIQFVIEAIQAEAFNPKTLFLIGSYTIGKERLFLEVARVLRKKIYVSTAKLRLLECLELSNEEMKWLTSKEHESQIHVVPMWTLASFKRLKYLSNQYSDRFNLIVAFSPTGWTFGKGKKKSPGRRWQQGTIIRYEVPYSEHSSFSELKEFVKLVSPGNIIPSVNNHGPESSNAMLSLLLS